MRAAWAAVVLAALVALPTGANAQWKWRDANGRLQVSDRPPPAEVADKDILQRPTAPRPAPVPSPAVPATAPLQPAAKPAAVPTELDKKRLAAEKEQAAQKKADEERQAAQRRDNCQRAQSVAATLGSGQRVTRMNAQGEREFLDDRARADELRRAQAVIASDCR